MNLLRQSHELHQTARLKVYSRVNTAKICVLFIRRGKKFVMMSRIYGLLRHGSSQSYCDSFNMCCTDDEIKTTQASISDADRSRLSRNG